MALKERIREIITLIEESDINEVEVSIWWGRKIRVAKHPSGMITSSNDSASQASAISDAPAARPDSAAPAAVAETPPGNVIRSPIVGTYYKASAPDTPPFIEVGDKISVGQIIGIVEAMKIMNEIESDLEGEVLEILVENAAPVEFNQPLVVVKSS